jgi:ABC-type multidrug transport system fused ATPase/permease subunit
MIQVGLLIKLWSFIDSGRKKQFVVLLFLMVIASLSEIITLGAVAPFLGILTAPEKFFQLEAFKPLITLFSINDSKQLLLPLTVAFCMFSLVSGSLRLYLLRKSTDLAFMTGADIGSSIFKRVLFQPYMAHVSSNSSEVVDGISNKANAVVYGTLLPLVNILTGLILLISLLIALIYIEPYLTIITFSGFGFLYVVIVVLTKKKLVQNSKIIAKESVQVIKVLQEGLGGIRDVLIDQTQDFFYKSYKHSDNLLRQAQSLNQCIAASPRFVMESVGIILISAIAYFVIVNNAEGELGLIPMLGVLALGAQRLLPVIQNLYSSWANMKGSERALIDVIAFLELPYPMAESPDVRNCSKIDFNEMIEISDLCYSYSSKASLVFSNLNLSICKGERVGIIGATGSGKSTLIDIIIGLLEPTSGYLKVDGVVITASNSKSWQSHIAYVPQFIFLADTTILQNIAFGTPLDEIDIGRVKHAAVQAQIYDFINGLENGFDEIVGERGVKLSGGQRQRIGIARALYKKVSLIIFDEATSALDGKTEASVMNSIDGLDAELTVLIIAHRLSTLKKCSKIIDIEALSSGNGN